LYSIKNNLTTRKEELKIKDIKKPLAWEPF